MAVDASPDPQNLLQIGELCKAVGKSARALHLYEELGLLTPVARSAGGFRLYSERSVERVSWILKLQRIGFTLPQIREFVRDFESSDSGRDATSRVRELFRDKLDEVTRQLAELRASRDDLLAALAYLDACEACAPALAPVECKACHHQGHQPSRVPPLFAGLSQSSDPFDVDVAALRAARSDGGTHGA